MLNKILKIVGVLIALVMIVPAFLSSHFSMSRTIEINAPAGMIFSNLTDLNEYMKWNPFPEGDPTNKESVTGSGVGSSLSWVGEKTGEGKMTISGIEPDKKIDIKMEFYKPFTGEGTVQWILIPKSDSTTEMTWTFEENHSYFKRYFSLIAESMMGPHFEKGLKNYKSLIESSKQ